MAIPAEISGFTQQLFGREPTSEELAGGASKSVGELADWLRDGGGGGGRSAAGPDISQVPSTLEFAQGLGASEDLVLQALIERMAGREQPLALYTRLEEEAGLPTLRTTARSLQGEIAKTEDYLDQIEPNITARTRESIVTEAQRARMVGAERLPFLQTLGKLTTGLGRVGGAISEALQGIGTKTELGIRGQEMELEPYKLRFQALTDRNSRLLTGFSLDRETALNALYEKWNRQNFLDDREWSLANTLAGQEKDYIRSLQGSVAKLGVNITGSESSQDLLRLMGEAVAEEIAYSRRTSTPTPITFDGEGERESEWEYLNPGETISGLWVG